MNKRLVCLAPIALAVLLSGCSITVHSEYLAPRELTDHSVELTNEMRTGPAAKFREVYNFNRMGDAITEEFVRATDWSYDRDDRDSATLSLTFDVRRFVDLRITCELTFLKQDRGEHTCVYEEVTATMLGDRTDPAGSSSGEFRVHQIGPSRQ